MSEYGLDPDQLRLYVVRPALRHLGLWSASAENLVLGTGMVESALRYVRQLGGGPALSLWQVEPATYRDLWYSYLAYHDDLGFKLASLAPVASAEHSPELLGPDAAEYGDADPPVHERYLLGSLYLGAAVCRLLYRRAPEPLGAPDDPLWMAHLWKKRYNTPLGAGTVEKALPHFARACAEVQP